jgi:lysophospholipase L1-like esterase
MKSLALIPFGVVLALALLEGGLQLAAWGMRSATGQELVLPRSGDRLRVVCLGDSNTYGLRLEPKQSYPAQLEALWAERVRSPTLEVYNLGYPGMNSSRLVGDLPELLDRLAPDVLLLMVGVNDFWTRELALGGSGEPSLWRRVVRRSRVLRLYWLLRARFEAAPAFTRDPRPVPAEGPMRMQVGEGSFDVGYERAESGEQGSSESLRANLMRLVELGRERGVDVVLMSYPARNGLYPGANRVIQRTAALAKAPFVDLAKGFRRRCPEERCPELLFADGHPNAAGYRAIAEILVEQLSTRYGR